MYDIDEPSEAKLRLVVEKAWIPRFFPLLRTGVLFKTRLGCSIADFLTRELGLDPEYVERRVQTVFLDGKCVDHLGATSLMKGSVLALSASMPGLAGATFRKAGFYSSLRSQISHTEDITCADLGEGTVVLKLFNLLTRELGPRLLEQGLWVDTKDLDDLLTKHRNALQGACVAITFNGSSSDLEGLPDLMRNIDRVFLQLQPGPSATRHRGEHP